MSENEQCMLYQGTSKDRCGYAKVSYVNPVTKVNTGTSAQRMAKMIEQRQLDLGPFQASHICHNKLCVRSDHINMEDRATNNARRVCLKGGLCVRHPTGDGSFHPDCLLALFRGMLFYSYT